MSLEMIKAENLDDGDNAGGKFSTALNNQGPEVTKVITVRKKKPWFGNELKLQKRKVHRRGKVLGNIDYNPAGLLLTVKGENTKRCYWMQKLNVTVYK